MAKLIKKYKIEETWTPNNAKMLNEMLTEIYNNMQARDFDTVKKKPHDSEGVNGEIKIDETNKKLYVKSGSAWKGADLT